MAWSWGGQAEAKPKGVTIRPPPRATSGAGNAVSAGLATTPFSKGGGAPPPVPPSMSELMPVAEVSSEPQPTPVAEPNPWSSRRKVTGRAPKTESIATTTTLAVASTAMVGQIPESACVDVDASSASRTVRMTNFPASWVTAANEGNLVAKIRNLLEKFGGLGGDIIVQRFEIGPPVATAPFEEEGAAQAAIQTLHGVDNRNQHEKKKAGHSQPEEWEKFCVQLAIPAQAQGNGDGEFECSPVSAVEEEMHAIPDVSPEDLPKQIRISAVPVEWKLQMVQEMCSQYGVVKSCVSEGMGNFTATFTSQANAQTACQSLQGMQVQSDNGYCMLGCIQPGVSAPEPLSQAPPPLSALPSSAEAYDPEAEVRKGVDDQNHPLSIYVDELKLAGGDPMKIDREIYLRDLPLEDYSETQLREWLESFGRVDHVEFLKEPSNPNELSGKGYVKFPTHEEAVGLIAAFPVDDEEGNVQGTWSLSERLRRGAQGPLGVDVLGKISDSLPSIKSQISGCLALHLVGEGCEQVNVPFQSEPLEPSGPIRFVVWPRSLAESASELLKSHLTSMLDNIVPAPLPTTSSRGKSQDEVADSSRRSRSRDQMDDDDSSEEDDVDEAPGDAEEAPIEEPTSPCVRVKGFPASWTEQQVRLVFALFGGVASVKFIGRSGASDRIAHVELKVPENMEKAVEQLHNTQVGDGDLIEECTVLCELVGQVVQKSKGAVRHTLFVDDLPMPKRPDLPPGELDREVFLQGLPVEDCTKDQIKSWLEGFGAVEDVHLLRDPYSDEPTGRGYVRFVTHREARACVEAQASAVDAEEGDVVASWSESERAARRQHSVYGMDVNAAFAGKGGRVTAAILVASKMKELWMLSEQFQPKDKGAPAPEAKQLHFCAVCTDEQFQELRRIIANALQQFHEKVCRRLRDPAIEQRSKRPAAAVDGSDPMQVSAAAVPPPPPGAWAAFPPPSGPPGSWYDWRGAPQTGSSGPPSAAPPRDPYSQHPPLGPPGSTPPPPPPGGWYPPTGPPGQFMSSAYPNPWAPPPVPTSVQPGRGETGQIDEKPRDSLEDDKEAPFEPAMQKAIEHGERCVRDGKRAEAKGSTEKAYERYCRGLQYLLDVMPKLDGRPRGQELRQRITGYLDEAEKLKQKLDAVEAPAPAETRAMPELDQQNVEATVVEATAHSKSAGAPPVRPRNVAVKSGPATPPHTLSKASSKSGPHEEARPVSTPRENDRAFLDSKLADRVKRGEALIRAGEQSEQAGKFDEAYEKYCRGLQHLLEVMPKLTNDSPQVTDLRKKIDGYLEQAERLKEKLETPPGGASGREAKSRLPPPRDDAGAGSRHKRRHHSRGPQNDPEPPPHRDGPRRGDGGNDRPRSRSPPLRQLPHRRNRGAALREGGEPLRSRSRSGGRRMARGLPQAGGATLRPGPKASLREYRGDRGDRSRGRDSRAKYH